MRPGEQHGVDYLFVTAQQFEEWIEAGALLEHAVVYGDYKGIPLSQARGARLRFVSSTGPLRRGRGAARGPGGSPPRRGRARAGDRRAGARHGRHPAPGRAGRGDRAAAPAGRRVSLPGARLPALRPPRLRVLHAPGAVLQLPPARALRGLAGVRTGAAAHEAPCEPGRRGSAAGTAGGGLLRAQGGGRDGRGRRGRWRRQRHSWRGAWWTARRSPWCGPSRAIAGGRAPAAALGCSLSLRARIGGH